MADKYVHRPDGVAAAVTKMRSLISDYKDKIVEITNLVNTIEGSTSWKDAIVKTEFIATCNSYILVYKNLATSMENYVNYLSSKSSSGEELERAFSG
ncbi:MAG: hypothetical protein ACI4XM_05025 [Candidatus Coprovivens sp.]